MHQISKDNNVINDGQIISLWLCNVRVFLCFIQTQATHYRIAHFWNLKKAILFGLCQESVQKHSNIPDPMVHFESN